MQARHASIGEVRGKGLMIGVEFVQDRAAKTPDARIRNRIVELAFEHGLLIMGCGANTHAHHPAADRHPRRGG